MKNESSLGRMGESLKKRKKKKNINQKENIKVGLKRFLYDCVLL